MQITAPRRRVLSICLAGAISCTLAQAASATAVGELPATMIVAGRTLGLASCGVRDLLWMDYYAAGLYAPSNLPAGTAVQDPRVPMAIRIDIIDPTFFPSEIPERWRRPLRDILSGRDFACIAAAYAALRAGDVLIMSYAPARGVSLAVNDRIIAASLSHVLIDAMLRAWAEDSNVRMRLQQLLSKHRC